MKKCHYCGKEYPDDAVRCLIDDELLLGEEKPTLPPINEEAPAAPAITPVSGPEPSAAVPAPGRNWTDRQIRIIEVVLVCAIAFGSSILSSVYIFLQTFHSHSETSAYSYSGTSAYSWTVQLFREGSALGLLWYVLLRRGKSFSDLGMALAWKDIAWAIILRCTGTFASRMVYNGIHFTGLTTISHQADVSHVNHMLYGGGAYPVTIFPVTFLFQLLNPFCEELIVRAYLMTEVKYLTGSVTKAILLSTIVQTSYHFYQGVPAALGHGATFLIWSIFYAKTNRIAPIILAHLYNDVYSAVWYFFRQ